MRGLLKQSIGHDEAMPLYPHVVNRFANAFPGLGLAVFAVSQLPHAESAWLFFIMVIAGMTLMIRGYRMGARCNESAVVVYGLLSTCTIAKSDITSGDTDVNTFPSLRWRTAGNKRRWTPIIALWGVNGEFHFIRLLKIRRLEQLHGWLERGPRRKR